MLAWLVLAAVVVADGGIAQREIAPREITLDLTRTPHAVRGAVQGFRAQDPGSGTLQVRLVGGLQDRPGRSGELLFDLRGTALARQPWGDAASVRAEVRVGDPFVTDKRGWARPHRARLFVEDGAGRRQYLPHTWMIHRPASTGGWLRLGGRPTASLPVPLGFTEPGFDPAGVVALGLSVEAANREETVSGEVTLRGLAVSFRPVSPQVLPADPAVQSGEAARARRMGQRLRARLGTARLAVGANLAWPAARSPNGEVLQLYGRLLDAGAPWWGAHWDLGHPTVQAALRTDLREIRHSLGRGAVVRVFLLCDLRTGVVFDEGGTPTGITPRALLNMHRLLRMARQERVLLMPVLLDFTMADGTSLTGPGESWAVGERPQLITDPARRRRLVAVLEGFVRRFAGHPAVLAWDLMNEPENAAAVVNAEGFAHLQRLMRELAEAVHRTGEPITIGHRNPADAARFWRGRVPTDLGQVHHYPLSETRKTPYDLSSPMAYAFGPLPAGWGEAQADPANLAAQIAQARRSGARFLLYWSWRGHDDTGDGFTLRPHAEELRRAR